MFFFILCPNFREILWICGIRESLGRTFEEIKVEKHHAITLKFQKSKVIAYRLLSFPNQIWR